MHLPEILVPRKFLGEEVEYNWCDYSKGEPKKQHSILALMSKNLDRSNGTPKNGCCKECSGTWTSESHWSVRGTDIFDVDLTDVY